MLYPHSERLESTGNEETDKHRAERREEEKVNRDEPLQDIDKIYKTSELRDIQASVG